MDNTLNTTNTQPFTLITYTIKETRTMEQEIEKVKIKTLNGRIITLTVHKRTDTHILGSDLFDKAVIIPITDIHSMFPLVTRVK